MCIRDSGSTAGPGSAPVSGSSRDADYTAAFQLYRTFRVGTGFGIYAYHVPTGRSGGRQQTGGGSGLPVWRWTVQYCVADSGISVGLYWLW